MVHIVDFVNKECTCSKCGAALRGDQGYLLSDGTTICVKGDKCSLRETSKPIDAHRRWRRQK